MKVYDVGDQIRITDPRDSQVKTATIKRIGHEHDGRRVATLDLHGGIVWAVLLAGETKQ